MMCSAAVQRALEIDELCLKGDLAEINSAMAIAKLGSIDCYDFLQEGCELVELMGEFAAPFYVWDVDQPDDHEKAAISWEIGEALSEFVMRARSSNG